MNGWGHIDRSIVFNASSPGNCKRKLLSLLLSLFANGQRASSFISSDGQLRIFLSIVFFLATLDQHA